MTTIAEIQTEVCAYFDIRSMHMLGTRRARCVARPRQIAIYLARDLTDHSYPVIGRYFGGRDHSTCMHAVRVIGEMVKTDQAIAVAVAEIRQRLATADESRQREAA